jgi:cysteine desulfurase
MNNLDITRHHPGLSDGPIYLDYNATTPVDPRVAETAQPYLTTHFGNPSSGHDYAERPRRALAEGRQRLAGLIGAEPAEMVFTASGSETNNLAIRGAALAHDRAAPAQIITQASEHPAVLETCRALQRLHGVQVRYLPVDQDGQVDPAALADAHPGYRAGVDHGSKQRDRCAAAHHRTGGHRPCPRRPLPHRRRPGGWEDSHRRQSLGRRSAHHRRSQDVRAQGHRRPLCPFRCAAGASRLWRWARTRTRAGTETVALAVALGAAAHIARIELDAGGVDRIRTLRDMLHHRLDELLPGRVQLNGHRDQRLPNTLNISITGVAGDHLLAVAPGIAASTGSACHTATPAPSPVLLAMGHDPGRAVSALRLTLGRWTTREDIEQAALQIAGGAVAHPTAML